MPRQGWLVSIHIYIDADACPVRDETYKVAFRHNVNVTVVANAFLRIPNHPLVNRVTVSDAFDAADDYIAERAKAGVIVITADILLADRALKSGAKVIGPSGKAFTEDTIGAAIATRAIMADLRAGATSENIGGPPPFTNRDRSQFLQTLHEAVSALMRD